MQRFSCDPVPVPAVKSTGGSEFLPPPLHSNASIISINSLNTAITRQLYLAEHSTYPHFQCFRTRFTMFLLFSLESPQALSAIANCCKPLAAEGVLLHKRSCLLPTTKTGTLRMSLLSTIWSLRVLIY